MEGYVALRWVVANVVPSAYAWAKDGRLEIETINGEKYMTKSDVEKLTADLASTCLLAEASRLAGIPKGSMRYYIDHIGIIKTREVAGRERVVLSSIEPAKEYLATRPERMIEQNRQAAKSQWANKREAQQEMEEAQRAREEAVRRKRERESQAIARRARASDAFPWPA